LLIKNNNIIQTFIHETVIYMGLFVELTTTGSLDLSFVLSIVSSIDKSIELSCDIALESVSN